MLTNFKALNCMTCLVFHLSQCILLQKQILFSKFFYFSNQVFSMFINRFNFLLHNVNVTKVQISFTSKFAVIDYKIQSVIFKKTVLNFCKKAKSTKKIVDFISFMCSHFLFYFGMKFDC